MASLNPVFPVCFIFILKLYLFSSYLCKVYVGAHIKPHSHVVVRRSDVVGPFTMH